MIEREMIAITGTGGSGKSNLAKALVDEFSSAFPVEHLSFGDYVRQQKERRLPREIARSAFRTTIIDHLHESNPNRFNPFDEPIALGILNEMLARSNASLILVDGYPRYGGQLSQLHELSIRNDINLKAIILARINLETATERIMKRKDDREIKDPRDAHNRIDQQFQGINEVRDDLKISDIPYKEVETYGTKLETKTIALSFLSKIISLPQRDDYPHAS